MKILVLGDIHGRRFWKRAVERYIKKVDKIIFLGDYFDPYDDEGIEYEFNDIVENYHEIITLKRENDDKVVLLLGNHDLHYISKQFDDKCRSTRYDAMHHIGIGRLFNENIKLFKLCHYEEIGGKKVYFTHAGITEYWLKLAGLENDDNLSENINHLFDTADGINKLAIVGRERTWLGAKSGSPVWCDLREFVTNKGLGEGTYQIFGHTRLKRGVSASSNDFACIDSQYGFVLNDKCKIRRITDEKVKTNEKQRAVQNTEDDKQK